MGSEDKFIVEGARAGVAKGAGIDVWD
jgi:hypothetical protein